jgi:hypothetical protein
LHTGGEHGSGQASVLEADMEPLDGEEKQGVTLTRISRQYETSVRQPLGLFNRPLRRDRPGRGRQHRRPGKMVVSRMQLTEGITRTLTCPIVNL